MFRPDPQAAHTVDETIAKLIAIMKELPSDSPRAQRLADMVRRLNASQPSTDHP
jgi:hypothetical protein